MNVYKISLLALLLILTTACSYTRTIDQDFEYSANDEEALLVVYTSRWGSDSINFVPVDISATRFDKGKVTIFLSGLFATQMDAGENGSGSGKFYLKRVKPGNYALVSTVSSTTTGTTTYVNHTCYSQGTNVYELDAGKISVISVGGVVTVPAAAISGFSLPVENVTDAQLQ